MYERFFNLTADPFRLSPDHRFCYKHARYSRAKAYMAYAFRRAEGFVMVTGPPGTGKTTLIGDLLEYLSNENAIVASLVSTQLAADDLLRSVAFAFDVEALDRDKSTLLELLKTRFLALNRDGGRALLIVDEAQDLQSRSLEELRLLTNLQQDGKPLLQIFLLGQPDLRDLVHDKNLESVHQRIIAASHLEPLHEAETRGYVEHRLSVVGWEQDPILTPKVYSVIFRFSGGVPRRINLICNRLFLYAFVEQKHKINVADARVVVKDLQDEQLSKGNMLGDEIFLTDDDGEDYAEAAAYTQKRVHPEDGDKPQGKAQFEAHDTALPATDSEVGAEAENKNLKKYMGPQQRRGHRREGRDRRDEIRYEKGKEDRRKNPGRRRDDESPEFW